MGLRALVAFLIALLQLASALHFTLVPHTFSTALGGVVHVHDTDQSRLQQQRAPAQSAHSQIVPAAPTCSPELCPFANAPHGSLPLVEATVSGAAQFGASGLLGKADAREASSCRVLASAPKTSPPV